MFRFAPTYLILLLMIAGFQCLPAQAADSSVQKKRPNIVLIVVDDLGYGDTGCYGSRINKTPHIDKLASEGMRFTDFHSNGPMCTPTRAALLTGKYQQRFGRKFEAAISGQTQYDEGLPLEAFTIAEALKQAGYVTGMFGKWHLGYHHPFIPTEQGFDEFRGLVSGDGDHHSHIDRSGRKDWWNNNQIEMESGYSVDLLTKHSVDFIERHQDEQFFLYVPHLAIHFPWQGPQDKGYRQLGTDYHSLKKLGQLSSKNIGSQVTKMVESVDQSVGQIMTTLKKLNLEENTIVFFTSDNGGYLTYEGGHHNISSNGIYRGQKTEVYEGGHRVPAIARWPGKIKAGSETDATTMTFDLFPTFLELAGIPYPHEKEKLDGVTIAPLLLNRMAPEKRTLFWRMRNLKAVRKGVWKLVIIEKKTALYNLEKDPGEKNDLSAQFPGILAQLKNELQNWEADVDK
jgi:arylsulfatase A